MRKSFLQMPCAFAVCFALGMAFADQGKDESGQGRERDRYSSAEDSKEKKHKKDPQDGGHDSYFHQHGYTRLNIPRGHYPPPGECRVWYPDRPAGHQPPPERCEDLRLQVPPGAWLIRQPEDDLRHVHINVYDGHRPDTVRVIGEFDIGSGTFVRIVLGK